MLPDPEVGRAARAAPGDTRGPAAISLRRHGWPGARHGARRSRLARGAGGEMDGGAGCKLDAVGVYHQHLIQDQAVAREPLERPASSGGGGPGRGLGVGDRGDLQDVGLKALAFGDQRLAGCPCYPPPRGSSGLGGRAGAPAADVSLPAALVRPGSGGALPGASASSTSSTSAGRRVNQDNDRLRAERDELLAAFRHVADVNRTATVIARLGTRLVGTDNERLWRGQCHSSQRST